MVFEQFYLNCLAQASYLIGSGGIAAVVDPQRDVDQYIEFANQQGLRIAHVIETHLHADFVSGHRELAARTGARIYLGAGSSATFSHTAVCEGDEIGFGTCRLRFLATPGHTVESVCILITDLERSSEPWAVLTGDTLFIGDVGRPDLSDAHTPQELAGLLYESLHRKLLVLADDVSVYPAHGAGSMCGRNLKPDRCSTIGRERQFNCALQPMPPTQFISMMTQDLPARPDYFQRDVDLNRRGAMPLSNLPRLQPLSTADVLRLRGAGAVILDTRPSQAFCSGHIPGSINIGLDGQFAAWAGSVLGLDRNLILIAEDLPAVAESQQRLARVGIEIVAGFVDAGVMGWVRSGQLLEHTVQISARELSAQLACDDLLVLDVRRANEWDEGRIPGSRHIPLDELAKRLLELDSNQTAAVYCKSGYRSSIASSLLQANAFRRVLNLMGGFDAWSDARLPMERETVILN
jgi:hydroxyacylglutathione hydrolase